MEVNLQNHGFVPDEIVPEEHYILGASKFADAPVLMPSGHGWGKYKPESELQHKNGLETMNCSNYATHNALETLANFHGFLPFPKNCSERYSGVLTGTTPSGNSPHKVIEIIRTEIGVIPETALPFGPDIKTWDEYYSPNPMDEHLHTIGRMLLDRYEIGHEWVFVGEAVTEKQAKLKDALSRGTVCVSVLAWKWRTIEDGEQRYTKETSERDNHWVQLLDYEEGDHWLVYDQYEHLEKKLDWRYDFGFAKVYYLGRLPEGQKKVPTRGLASIWKGIVWRIKQALGRF